MEMIRERISFTFDPRDRLLSLQMGFSLVRAAVACAKLWFGAIIWNNCSKALKACYSAQLLPFLISIWVLVQVLMRLSIRASSYCSSSTRASMSSVNRRLVIFLLPLLTFLSFSSRASDMIRSRKMLKRVGDRRHPCLTPAVFFWITLLCCHSSGLHL